MSTNDYAVLSANDLGMHCADLDYRIFSILPPFNVVHAQVIRLGDAGRLPRRMNDRRIEVVYSATSGPDDPAGANSTNTTSKNLPSVFNTNFWKRTGTLVELPGCNETGNGKTITLSKGTQASARCAMITTSTARTMSRMRTDEPATSDRAL